jgi:hypothetical protein
MVFSLLASGIPIACGANVNGSTVDQPLDWVYNGGLVQYNFSVSQQTTVGLSTCGLDNFDTEVTVYNEYSGYVCGDSNYCGRTSYAECVLQTGDYFIIVATGSAGMREEGISI